MLALLADAGNEVWAIDTWQEHIDAIKENGLRVEGASGDRTVKINASTNALDAGECDLIIVATKASGVATVSLHAAKIDSTSRKCHPNNSKWPRGG